MNVHVNVSNIILVVEQQIIARWEFLVISLVLD